MIANEEQTRALVDMLSEALDDIGDLQDLRSKNADLHEELSEWRKFGARLCGGARNKGIAHESDPENVRSMSLVGMDLFGAVDELKLLRADVNEVLGLAGYDSLDELLADLREGSSVVRAGYCDEQRADRERWQEGVENWQRAAAKVNDYAFAKDLGTTPHKMMTQGMLREAGAEMYRRLQDWRAVAQHVCKGEVTPGALHKAIQRLQKRRPYAHWSTDDIRMRLEGCEASAPIYEMFNASEKNDAEADALRAELDWRYEGARHRPLYQYATLYPGRPSISITCTATLDEVTP